MNKNGFGPKVLVEVRMVSLLGGWKTDAGTSASNETPTIHKAHCSRDFKTTGSSLDKKAQHCCHEVCAATFHYLAVAS